MTINTCLDCANHNEFCVIHQANEKEVYESARFEGLHDTQEFRMAIHDARNRDMRGE